VGAGREQLAAFLEAAGYVEEMDTHDALTSLNALVEELAARQAAADEHAGGLAALWLVAPCPEAFVDKWATIVLKALAEQEAAPGAGAF
jgi:hypothetical protein